MGRSHFQSPPYIAHHHPANSVEVQVLSSASLTARTKALYTALSGDRIERQKFWPAFKEHAKRRHAIVHAGATATKTEADASLAAAVALIEHVIRVTSAC